MPIFRCCRSKLCDRYRSGIFFERTEDHLFNQVTLGDDGTQKKSGEIGTPISKIWDHIPRRTVSLAVEISSRLKDLDYKSHHAAVASDCRSLHQVSMLFGLCGKRVAQFGRAVALWQPTHRPRILRAAALAASETPAPGPAQPAHSRPPRAHRRARSLHPYAGRGPRGRNACMGYRGHPRGY